MPAFSPAISPKVFPVDNGQHAQLNTLLNEIIQYRKNQSLFCISLFNHLSPEVYEHMKITEITVSN